MSADETRPPRRGVPIPPKLVRRLVLAPVVAAVEVVALVISPLLLLVAALASPLFGGWRPLRLGVIGVIFAAHHLVAMVACLGLWIASGFGRTIGSDRMQRAHYAVLRWFLSGVYDAVVRWARVEVEMLESEAADEIMSTPERPVLVLSRHAGEGDTLLVLHQLLCRHGRRPRVVMHEALRLDPLIDVIGERLPNRFLDPRGGDTEKEIAAMSGDLGHGGAVVIFPEGANFTESRRQRSIERLEHRGHAEEAGWAREMRNVAAPRPGGSLAALTAAPDADVVIVGHVGFPEGFGDLWRMLPVDQRIEVRMWHVPPAEIPTGSDEQIDWLFGRWRDLDAWIEERTPDA